MSENDQNIVNLIGQPQPQGSRRLEIIPGETQAERTKRLRASAQAARRVANRNRVALLQFACKYPMPDFKDLDNPLYNLKIALPNIQSFSKRSPRNLLRKRCCIFGIAETAF
jgi:hypothetical protein